MTLWLAVVLAAADGGTVVEHGHHGHGLHHGFGDVARWAKVFDAPERDGWQKPDEVLKRVPLRPGQVLADVGAGTGYFAVRFAKASPKAKVVAVDVERSLVEHLEARAKAETLSNLTARLGTASSPNLEAPVDVVLVVDTYHHVENRPAYFQALPLKPDGRLVVIDFRLESAMGPPKAHKVPPERIVSELGEAGFRLVERHEILAEQHFFIFQKSSAPPKGGTPAAAPEPR